MYAELTRKCCSKCSLEKSLEDFYKQVEMLDGKASWCKECVKALQKNYQQGHYREKKNSLNALYNKKHPEKYKNWAKRNPGKIVAKTVRYKLRKSRACLSWLSEEQIKQIEQMYVNRPRGYHVDHIVPLKGKNVCGLHVPWNLQYLPTIENLKKSNKW
jgi:hypothetical protein